MRILVLFVLAFGVLCHAQTSLKSWTEFDFAKNRIKPEQLKVLDADELAKVRGIVFGKHGRVFVDADIKEYLNGQEWYTPNPKFSNKLLNSNERFDLDVIRGAEAGRHKSVEPGDLRYWRDKPIPPERLSKSSLLDLHVMACEIEAIHGRKFADEPSMQKYFEDRYWYQPTLKYNSRSLTGSEKTNLGLLRKLETEKRKTSIEPGDMAAFEKGPLKLSQLKGVSLYDLRVLRNEVYARRGYRFSTKWLLDYFSGEEWYKPLPKRGKEPPLTKIEEVNVDTILKQEARLHEALLTKPVTDEELDGIYLEDASKLRYEIQARHGKRFTDPWLRSYFSSLAWYKASSKYSDKMLSAIERKNIAQIKKYESHAASQFHAVEG